LEIKTLSQYIKPKVLKVILERNTSVLQVPMLLLDVDGEAVADSLNGSRPSRNMAFPLTVRGSMVGTLVGYEKDPYRGERLQKALENVAENIIDLITCELKLDSMSEELLHNYKVLNLFYNVSNSLVNILSVRKVCNIILDRIVATIGLSKASVLLLDNACCSLRVVAHKGLPDAAVRDTLFPLKESICKEVIEKGKPLFIQNIDHYPGMKKRSKGKYRSKSFVSVPILDSSHPESQKVLGVINVADKLSGEPFYSGDMKLIMALTSLAAMSIQNAGYFEDVKRSKEEWESTFDAITDSVAILDQDYRLLKVNKAYEQSWRDRIDDLTDSICYRFFYQREDPCPGCPATDTLQSGEPAYAEKKVGEKIFRQWTYPIKNIRNESTSVVMYTRDVTSLKTLKDRLIQSERMATIGQFAAGMAHEIRNPLSSIVTAAEVLSTQGDEDKENLKTLTDIIKVEAKRLNEIISEFLLYATPQRPEFKENDLNQVVDEVLRMIRTDSEQKGMHIETSLDPAIGATYFDADKIRQVIWNLVLNGIQSMKMGQTLTVSTRKLPEGTALVVKDAGEGIAENHLKRIFDPFFTTKTRGTGLGLSIVNRIIEDHHGRIEVQSGPGQGSEFTALLPQESPD
jgi:signal transduction histidine kinase